LKLETFGVPYIHGVSIMSAPTRILYCNCTYAQVVPKEVKEAVLKKLCESGVAFEAVADLCEMSARQDAGLKRLAEEGSIKIAACFPRAIKWLFHTAKAPLPIASTEVLNMRAQSAEEIISRLFDPAINPNVPAGKITLPAPSELPASATAGQDQPTAVVAP
jgi:hypothetical protein